MAAFTGYDPIDKEREDSKYGSYNVAALEAKAPKNTPSPQGAASQGALGAPAPAGGDSAFKGARSEGATGKTKGESYFDYHKSASDDDRRFAADQLDAQLGSQGSGVIGKANELVSQAMQTGDESTLAVAEKYGWSPTDAEGAVGPTEDRKGNKSKWSREDMGGFLTEVGLRILASNREDAGSAFGEAVLGTRQARSDKKRQKSADDMAAADRKRKMRREDAADESRRQADARASEKYEYEKTQRGSKEASEKRRGMVKTINKQGETYYYDPLDPSKGAYVEDAEGNRVRSDTAMDLSRAQMATNERAYKTARAKARTAIEKDAKEYNTQYPEVKEALEAGDKGKANALIDAAVDEVLERDGYTLGAGNNDPLGLL